MTSPKVKDSLLSLSYVAGQLKTYGEKLDYDPELMLRHLQDVQRWLEEDLQEIRDRKLGNPSPSR